LKKELSEKYEINTDRSTASASGENGNCDEKTSRSGRQQGLQQHLRRFYGMEQLPALQSSARWNRVRLRRGGDWKVSAMTAVIKPWAKG
jgi:hypothetical protein